MAFIHQIIICLSIEALDLVDDTVITVGAHQTLSPAPAGLLTAASAGLQLACAVRIPWPTPPDPPPVLERGLFMVSIAIPFLIPNVCSTINREPSIRFFVTSLPKIPAGSGI